MHSPLTTRRAVALGAALLCWLTILDPGSGTAHDTMPAHPGLIERQVLHV